jgi:tRNA (cmo5U34)-methyltransferase
MSDQIVYDKPFKFDELVASCFGDMLKRSVPEHDTMRELVGIVGEKYVKPDTTIVDVGCSWGDAVLPFVERHNSECDFSLYDTSESMLSVCKDRYDQIESVRVRRHDICDGIDDKNVSLILSVLTVQFTPIEKRHRLLRSFYGALNKGGALIYVEKVLGDTTDINEMLVDSYYETKKKTATPRNR